ncbi:uncharacterized protein BKCO1_2000176 [Diplodia corticola]|uniref:Uncharacterized protein n=1 Tax=Diplodia corticola TaxID=236234 RepID=A0A1J9RH53_9PEZI|nr:uncharacterized protein BKCO1_2000176 [Diplodia corticola]OJD39761.1 hypothetical protein BKCO1_2000176 [Diplodia corticola]
MPHSKVPGGQAPSDKFLKQQAQSHGLGADNAPAHKEGGAPGDAPVAGDSYTSNVGVGADATNVPGEQGDVGQKINERPAQ